MNFIAVPDEEISYFLRGAEEDSSGAPFASVLVRFPIIARKGGALFGYLDLSPEEIKEVQETRLPCPFYLGLE